MQQRFCPIPAAALILTRKFPPIALPWAMMLIGFAGLGFAFRCKGASSSTTICDFYHRVGVIFFTLEALQRCHYSPQLSGGRHAHNQDFG
jgi:hypothetical protein